MAPIGEYSRDIGTINNKMFTKRVGPAIANGAVDAAFAVIGPLE